MLNLRGALMARGMSSVGPSTAMELSWRIRRISEASEAEEKKGDCDSVIDISRETACRWQEGTQ